MLTASNSSSSNVSTVDVAWREGGGGAFAFSFDFAFVFALAWTTAEPCLLNQKGPFLLYEQAISGTPKTFQNLSVSSPAAVAIFTIDGYFLS